ACTTLDQSPYPTRRSSALRLNSTIATPCQSNRRSSDNDRSSRTGSGATLRRNMLTPPDGGFSRNLSCAKAARSLPPHTTTKTPRSEEHTSELQSRENLVCR